MCLKKRRTSAQGTKQGQKVHALWPFPHFNFKKAGEETTYGEVDGFWGVSGAQALQYLPAGQLGRVKDWGEKMGRAKTAQPISLSLSNLSRNEREENAEADDVQCLGLWGLICLSHFFR